MNYILELYKSLNVLSYLQVQGLIMGSIFTCIYAIEHIRPQKKEIIDFKHELYNFGVGIFNHIIVFLLGLGFYFILKYSAEHKIGLLHLFYLNITVKFILGFILIDIWMYWWHRANHIFSFLWFFHRFHHKDTKLNSTSAVRFHIGEITLSLLIRTVVFSLLGIEPLVAIIYEGALFFVIVLHHSNIKISKRIDQILRNFFVSPRMHRIHHSIIRKETDSNYSSVFPYWDMLFNTYNKEPSAPVEFGLPSLSEKINEKEGKL